MSFAFYFHSTPVILPFVFFFNDTATTEIYTLSLHDALPLSLFDRLRYYSVKFCGKSEPALTGRQGVRVTLQWTDPKTDMDPPMKWSLNQAAKEGRIGKATILRAIKSGRMSAPKNELGEYEIDPSEFYRVFPPTGSVPGSGPGTETDPDHQKTPFETGQLSAELNLIRERMSMAGQMHDK